MQAASGGENELRCRISPGREPWEWRQIGTTSPVGAIGVTEKYDRPVRGWENLGDLSQGLALFLRNKARALGYERSPLRGLERGDAGPK